MTDRPDHLTAMTESWARLTGDAMEAAVTANTAALDALLSASGPGGGDHEDTPEESTDDETVPGGRPAPQDERQDGAVDSVLYETDDWTVERSVSDDGPAVGDRVVFEKTITDDDVRRFAAIGGDTNRLHLDESFAEQTRFGGRIAHGSLVSALISAALARLPGVTIYLSQDLDFLGPVSVGDSARAVVKVVEDLGDGQYRLETVVEDDDETVVDGEAVVLVDGAPTEES